MNYAEACYELAGEGRNFCIIAPAGNRDHYYEMPIGGEPLVTLYLISLTRKLNQGSFFPTTKTLPLDPLALTGLYITSYTNFNKLLLTLLAF